ncbi:MAG: hypothetical protein AB2L07_08885 [Thermoanaerobaculaceae bacterium]
MNLWTLAPTVLLLFGCVVLLAAGSRRARRRLGAPLLVSLGRGLLAAIGFALVLGLLSSFVPGSWLRARPTAGWEDRARRAEVAVIFGYGLGPSGDGLTPGRSNKQLLEWTLAHTSATTLLVQEGVWVARCYEHNEACTVDGRNLVRMHRHVEGVRVDTFEAAHCAADLLLAMKAKRVVVVAHDLQLHRAASNLGRCLRTLGGRELEIVVPDVGFVVSPGSWAQWQTWLRPEYTLVELLWARPRDVLAGVPEQCPAP